MPLKQNKNLKLYYSIHEVAEMVGVTETLLRYWETEFPQLKPKTLPNKVRQYSEADIKQVKIIHNLLKVRGFKIAAARKMLARNPKAAEKSNEIMTTLISVRDQLKDLKAAMDTLA